MRHATQLETIDSNLLATITGGFVDPGPGGDPKSEPPVSGAHCEDGMDWGFTGKGKVKTPIGLTVEGEGTIVKCK